MTLLKLDCGQVIDEFWIEVGDDAPLPTDGAVIVGWPRWGREQETLAARAAPLGVRLSGDEPLAAVGAMAASVALVEVVFSSFRDGRGLSVGRLLRERYGFRGELRAAGGVIPDQAEFLRRCGFDTVSVADGGRLEDWRNCLNEISVFYQPTGDRAATALELRLRRGQNA